jgi:organic radical activating enzyme
MTPTAAGWRGNNPIRHKGGFDIGGYQVADMFDTVQGEGPFSGRRALFIRLTGCNLACTFCDTVWNDASDPVVTADEILSTAMELACHHDLVVLTGGEPLLQPVAPLIEKLLETFEIVQVETNGTTWWPEMTKLMEVVSPFVQIVVSPKTPKVHPEVERWATAWKYPLRSGHVHPDDGLPLINTQRKDGPAAALARPPASKAHRVFVTPVDEGEDGSSKPNLWQVNAAAQRHGYTAQVQLHKILGVK